VRVGRTSIPATVTTTWLRRFQGNLVDRPDLSATGRMPVVPGVAPHLSVIPLDLGGIGQRGRDIVADGLCGLAPPLTCYTCDVQFRVVPTAANRQPAFAMYGRSRETPEWRGLAIQLLTLGDDAISVLTTFRDTRLFTALGLRPSCQPMAPRRQRPQV
jgi:hypothetical protein